MRLWDDAQVAGSTKGMSDVQFVHGGIDIQVDVQTERVKTGWDDAQVAGSTKGMSDVQFTKGNERRTICPWRN